MISPTLPEAVRGPGDELYNALRKANLATRAGVPIKELDSYLLNRYGMTKKALTAAVKAMPQEVNSKKDVTTKMLAKAAAYGFTGGWSDEIEGLLGKLKGTGYAKARKAAQDEMKQFENDYPWLARGAKAYGLGVSGLIGGLGARAATVLGAGGKLSTATLAGSEAPYIGAAGRALTGAAIGANAGAGGMMGEESGMDRLPNAATGALMGGVAGAGTAIPKPSPSQLAKTIGLLGAGAGAGALGRKVLNFLSDR